MEIKGLWKKLTPIDSTVGTLKKDLAEGKVPELPYFIINQEEVKEVISSKLNEIDGDRMQTNLIIAPYGNGKTNLLKYLKLFFEDHKNIDVLYSRADVEQPDIVLFLLKVVQDFYTETLINIIKKIRSENFIGKTLANNYEDNFIAIKEYTNTLFSENLNEEEIRKLIYLGTGRLYTKNHFKIFDLQQFNNFNRRETLVLFLNILAQSEKYLIFAIDEVEKVNEKSKLRFNQFLTSYRELVDLFNKVKGHYLITCFTDASGSLQIQNANEALFTRLKEDIKELPPISKPQDVKNLAVYLNELFETSKNGKEIEKIVVQLNKFNAENQVNRYLIRRTVQLLTNNQESLPLESLLKKHDLEPLYIETKQKLELIDAFKSLHQKFFDPLEYYLESNFFLENNSHIERRDYQSFIDEVNNRIHFFIFNENTDHFSINKKVNNLIGQYNKNIIIYSPEKLELSNSSVEVQNQDFQFEIVDYNAEALFTLFNMYRDNLEYQDIIGEVISSYTENYL